MRKAIFPGSFDPIHKGHLQIIKKAAKLFDFLYVVVTFNNEKMNTSDFEVRKNNLLEHTKSMKNVEVIINKDKITAYLAKELGVQYLVRSARKNSDFEYELELAAGNMNFNNDLETILIIPNYSDIKYESRLIKQLGEKD